MDNKIVIKTEEFKDICSKILTAVDSSESSVVTETLEIVTRGKYMVVGVTNREYFAEVKMPMENECDFHATVNANLFLKLISQITTGSVELSVNGPALIVKGNGVYKLPLIFNGDKLLELPTINIENVTAEFPISADILNSILYYNSKELTKGTIAKPIQKLYYVDEQGCATFTSGACVNSFTLPQPIKLLFNNRLVKLFKLFKTGDVNFTLGYDAINKDTIQTKVKFENANVTLTAILSCDDTLLSSFPISAVRGRANTNHPYSVNIDKSALIQTINRLTLFNNGSNTVAKTFGIFEFGSESVTIFDANRENKEVIPYANNTSNVVDIFELKLNLDDFKATLETCTESHVCMNFGDGQAVVISRGNVKNVIPQLRTL